MPKEPQRKSSRRQLDSPTKNRLIGAIEVQKNVAKACRDMNVPPTTGYDLWHKYQETGSTHNRSRSGRPRVTTNEGREKIVEMAVNNRRKPLEDIGNEMEPCVSRDTVRAVLADEGYHRRVAKKVPYLSKLTKEKRLAWAKEHQHWTAKEWVNIAWSDEAYVVLGENKGRIWVTRKEGEDLLEECCVAKITQSSVRCMIWGSIMKGVKGPLVILEYPGGKGGGMTALRYQEQVLEGAVVDYYREMVEERPNFQFQQDGAPGHRAKSTLQWLADHNIPIFPHPPSSPDISPIEPVWGVLKKHLRSRSDHPATYEQLCDAIFDVWDEIDYDEIDQFIDRMPEVVQAVIDAEGSHTRY